MNIPFSNVIENQAKSGSSSSLIGHLLHTFGDNGKPLDFIELIRMAVGNSVGFEYSISFFHPC